MAVDLRSWGILGNPSKEKIEEYKNMPVGSFKNMVRNISRGKKGKVLQEHTVYFVKKESKLTRGVIKVEAFDIQDAYLNAGMRMEEVVWDEAPYKVNQVDYVKQNIDPLLYNREA